MSTKQRFLDLAERVGTTFIQSLVVWLLAAESIDTLDIKILLAAAIPAGINIVKVFLTSWMPQPTNWLADMLVRVGWTFGIGVTGAAATGGFDIYSVSAWQAVFIGAATAAGAVLKALVARRLSDTITPASLIKPPAGEAPMALDDPARPKDRGVIQINGTLGIIIAVCVLIILVWFIFTRVIDVEDDDPAGLALALLGR